ncbi:MAG: serine hydrolase domain-containing protein [Microbacterium gubbeenense]|uniref:serine hydrolase domain-containing protein n=1 Tax=Microbacterium gubbeenense TaxID=159896 RepID=UPI003F9E869D
MSRAQHLLDAVSLSIDEIGFAAHGVHVRVGDDAAQRRFTAEAREEIHSVAKAIAVLAVGIARDEGIFDPDAIVAHDYTTRDLLTMTTGVDFPWSPTMFDDHDDAAREFLSRPTSGRSFQYANSSTYTAMRQLAAATGDVEEWLRPRLFDPLGWHDVEWRRCPRGFVLAGEGLALTTDEIARLGLLLRDRGVYNGRRIVAGDWIDGMHSGWVSTGGESAGYGGYAMGGWRGPGDAWRLHGAGGQLVIFAGDAVITITGDDHFRADEVTALAVAAAA